MYTLGINAVYHDVDDIAYSYDPFLLLGKYSDDATITLPLEPSAHPTEWEASWDPRYGSTHWSVLPASAFIVWSTPFWGRNSRLKRSSSSCAGRSCLTGAWKISRTRASRLSCCSSMMSCRRRPNLFPPYSPKRSLCILCIRQQRKSMFNALLYKKHPALYRERIQGTPPWHYYRIVGALLVASIGLCRRSRPLALGGLGVWAYLTGRFCVQRLRRTSRAGASGSHPETGKKARGSIKLIDPTGTYIEATSYVRLPAPHSAHAAPS